MIVIFLKKVKFIIGQTNDYTIDIKYILKII